LAWRDYRPADSYAPHFWICIMADSDNGRSQWEIIWIENRTTISPFYIKRYSSYLCSNLIESRLTSQDKERLRKRITNCKRPRPGLKPEYGQGCVGNPKEQWPLEAYELASRRIERYRIAVIRIRKQRNAISFSLCMRISDKDTEILPSQVRDIGYNSQ
jgi:hypothetical protein